jgi:hypothetical protein
MTALSSAGAVMIDLTMDEDVPMTSTSHSRQSSAAYIPAVSVPPSETVKSKKMDFSSYDIKSLSSTRVSHTRLPDILQNDQKKNIYNASQPIIFTGWIKEHEESSADFTLTNDNVYDAERFPPPDWTYTDGYVLDEKSLEPPTRQATSSFLIPKGCGCDNDNGLCDPRTCQCYALHEKLAPNPWLWQYKTGEDGTDKRSSSDIRGDFAYKDGRLRPEVGHWPGAPIWECNSNCLCMGDCANRVVQNGRTVEFDLFKSATGFKGWGIRSKQRIIKAGTFINVYAGELMGWSESEDRGMKYELTKTTYILDIDSHHIKDALYCEPYKRHMKEKYNTNIELDHEAKTIDAAEEWANKVLPDKKMTYSVDAGLWGNLSRYFNHSCDPNMQIYPVYTEERDIRRPFLALFARRDILEGQELTFAYGSQGEDEDPKDTSAPGIKAEAAEQLQSHGLGTEVTVKVSDGKHSLTGLKCGCGASNCKGTVFRGK